MKKIVITGPESSGKTSLAHRLAVDFGISRVEEYARQYLNENGLEYEEIDLLKIAKGQWMAEKNEAVNEPDYLICDTDLLTIKIWSAEKYGQVHPWILERVGKGVDLYLLIRPTLPWEADPQRAHPEDRERLFNIYKKELKELQIPYVIIDPTKKDFYEQVKFHTFMLRE